MFLSFPAHQGLVRRVRAKDRPRDRCCLGRLFRLRVFVRLSQGRDKCRGSRRGLEVSHRRLFWGLGTERVEEALGMEEGAEVGVDRIVLDLGRVGASHLRIPFSSHMGLLPSPSFAHPPNLSASKLSR